MSVYRRYFRISGGELLKRAQEIEEEHNKARKVLNSFITEIGADNAKYAEKADGAILGFSFPSGSKVDPEVWKKPNRWGVHLPKKNTPGGIAMLERIEALPKIPAKAAILKDVGLMHDNPCMFVLPYCHYAGFAGAPGLGVFFIIVPWQDVDPAELAEYKKQHEAGVTFNVTFDHLLWTPHPDMVEVKEWEVLKEIEALKEKEKISDN